MTTETSKPTASKPSVYVFEDPTHRYEITPSSPSGVHFRTLSNGPEKIAFLKSHGTLKTKTTGAGEPLMTREKGVFRFLNEGQIEYRVLASLWDEERKEDVETEGEVRWRRLCVEKPELVGSEEERQFLVKEATLIREWPENVKRQDNKVCK